MHICIYVCVCLYVCCMLWESLHFNLMFLAGLLTAITIFSRAVPKKCYTIHKNILSYS